MRALLLTLALLAAVSGCVGASSRPRAARFRPAPDHLLLSAERKASAGGRAVLSTGREMTVARREILPGACWDYADAVYTRSGYPAKRRVTVYRTAKRGPYADPRLLRQGDLVSYINRSYGNVEHSAIFVDWIDPAAKQALMLSYGGERRREPARYLPYDLGSVYAIVRPGG